MTMKRHEVYLIIACSCRRVEEEKFKWVDVKWVDVRTWARARSMETPPAEGEPPFACAGVYPPPPPCSAEHTFVRLR